MSLQFVVGTRPEAIKIGPVVAECKRQGTPHDVIHTGQHTDLLMGTGLEPTAYVPSLPPVPRHLNPQEAQRWLQSQLRARLRPLLTGAVVVQGDTVSAYVAAGLANEVGLPLAHIEAGVRTYQEDPWPEEGYRVQIDRWADLGFCATDGNLANIRAEGCRGSFTVTGNPGVDAVHQLVHLEGKSAYERSEVIITLHRRESFGEPMRAIVGGILRAAPRYPAFRFSFCLHPNREMERALGTASQVNVTRYGALPYGEFLKRLVGAAAVITDSGGVQEDAATLGIPCVVARDHTDRPESVASGHAILGGRTAEALGPAIDAALSGQLKTDPSDCFGDGQASPRIVEGLKELLD